jgi:hypothetical protein
MSDDVERFRASRIYLAGVYADCAAKLAEAVKDDPAANARGEYQACQIAWGALVDVENALRASVLAGDVIDDYYREGATGDENSDAARAKAMRAVAGGVTVAEASAGIKAFMAGFGVKLPPRHDGEHGEAS